MARAHTHTSKRRTISIHRVVSFPLLKTVPSSGKLMDIGRGFAAAVVLFGGDNGGVLKSSSDVEAV